MNYLPKFVFSKTIKTVDWKNTEIINGDIEKEVKALKAQSGKDLILFGGSAIATSFKHYDLIDQYWLFVNSVVLGKGTPLFKDNERTTFSLFETKEFRCGNVLLKYINN